jgi:lysozyme family protein
MPDSALYKRVFAATVGAEGDKLDLSPNDRGNWTSGTVGVGVLKGSRFGLSAMTYPNLDIANLTIGDAYRIYLPDFFDKVRGDDLPAPLALLVFDAAVNSGVPRSSRWLQAALGVGQDGVIGLEETIPAVRFAVAQGHVMAVCAECMAQRLAFVGKAAIFQQDTLGLSRRMIRMAFLAASMNEAGNA